MWGYSGYSGVGKFEGALVGLSRDTLGILWGGIHVMARSRPGQEKSSA